MTIWKNTYRGAGNDSRGFSFHATRKEAKAQARAAIEATKGQEEATETTETEKLTFPATKARIIAALNRHGGHNDNG